MPPRRVWIARLLGGVLCLAAVMKGIDLFASPAEGSESILTLVGASVEFLIGAALIFRVLPWGSVPGGGLLFVLLAGASLIGASRGVASCGCLGMIAIPPWIMLVFDGGAAVALLWGPRTARAGRPDQATALDAVCIGLFFTGMAVGSILYPRLGP